MQSIESIYEKHCLANTAISPHLPRLRDLAANALGCVEFGVKRGASSSALLMGCDRVTSYDVVETREARELEAIAGEQWSYRIEDARKAVVPDAELFFLDSLHTFEQVRDELAAHGHKAGRWLVFHDTATFAVVGADGETGRQKWTYVPGKGSVPLDCLGIRFAIDNYMIKHPEWRIAAHYPDSHGLLVLERR